jgi:hypothetical protein
MIIRSGDLAAEFDPARGVLRGLRDMADAPDLNYLGAGAAFPAGGVTLSTGDLVCRVWDGGGPAPGQGWRLECTARRAEPRITRAGDRVTVSWPSPQLTIGQEFTAADGRLRWSAELTSHASDVLEVGELAFPLVANNDVAGIFRGHPAAERATGEPQRRWHENRVQQYPHIAGHGSYVLLQRPAGDRRVLAVIPAGDTPLEAAYQIDPGQGSQWSNVFEGPYFLAVRSRAARAVYGWLGNRERQNQWFHGSSSLLLEPGQSHRVGLEFALLDDVDELPGLLLAAGHAHVEAAPGFAAPLGQAITIAITSPSRPVLTAESQHVTIAETGDIREGNRWPFLINSDTAGQKSVRVSYDGNRWTRVLLYLTPGPAALLRARAEFIVREQLYDNPADPYGRHHAFLPYDDQLQQVYTASEESWQAGASDEYGLPVAMFLAEKNVHLPEPGQVAALEVYIADCLLGRLQDPVTLGIRRGLYYGPDLPSRQRHEWTEEDSRDEHRFNNYPLAANIYHAMYRIAVRHGLTSRPAAEYLTLAWRTAVHGFETGELPQAGAPAGAGLFDLLADLEVADQNGFAALDGHLRRFAGLAAADPYPYGSELYIDQTAHSQVYAALERYGPDAKVDDCLRVTRTLRWGFQPSWFRYGNDQRGSVCCWYGTPQNSEVLLKGFRRTGDRRLLRLGAAGLTSFLTSVRASGAARGWFTWWPDRTGFDSRTLDTDLGLFAYLRAAAAYVITEPGFGLTGYCCRARRLADGAVEVVPDNGVDDRIYFCDHDLAVRADGPIRRAVLSAAGDRLAVEASAGVRVQAGVPVDLTDSP